MQQHFIDRARYRVNTVHCARTVCAAIGAVGAVKRHGAVGAVKRHGVVGACQHKMNKNV